MSHRSLAKAGVSICVLVCLGRTGSSNRPRLLRQTGATKLGVPSSNLSEL